MYQRCPFCDRVFEIGETKYRPMRRHIRAQHADGGHGATEGPDASRAAD